MTEEGLTKNEVKYALARASIKARERREDLVIVNTEKAMLHILHTLLPSVRFEVVRVLVVNAYGEVTIEEFEKAIKKARQAVNAYYRMGTINGV